jgi:hypothetical protein
MKLLKTISLFIDDYVWPLFKGALLIGICIVLLLIAYHFEKEIHKSWTKEAIEESQK